MVNESLNVTSFPHFGSLSESNEKTPIIFNDSLDITKIHNVLLIDSRVTDVQLFYDSVNENTYPIIYSTNSAKEELLDHLNNKFPNGFNRLSILFHDPGYNLYKTFLDNKALFEESDLLENKTTYSENMSFLIDLVKNKNVVKIDFLACNTLSYPIWKQFYDLLNLQTNVTVGASNDSTGNVKYGADWIMESTNEDIKNVYFNANIDNYASTLAETSITNNTNIFIRQQSSTSSLEYSINNQTTWTSVGGNFPISITNSNITNTLNVKFTTDITISSSIGTNGFFYPATTHIIFDGLKSDNTRCEITIDGVTNYSGFFKNGDGSNNGKNYITVQNFNIKSTNNTSMTSLSGLLCCGYFSKAATNNLIKNCSDSVSVSVTSYQGGDLIGAALGSNSGSVTVTNCSNSSTIHNYQAGGVVGPYAGQYSGYVIITNCINYGTINGGGGIAGSSLGYSNGNVSITNCINYGTITGGGGIAGSTLGALNGTVQIEKCYNVGNISGSNSGGIVGIEFGYNTNNNCSITNSYNIGNVSGTNSGGICGGLVGYINNNSYNSKVQITNCYSRGTIATSCGGICGGANNAYSANPTVTISNCYTSGTVTDTNSGLIANSLTIKDNILSTNCYVANGNWLDDSANSILTNRPTNVYTQGTVWTKLAGTNIPYVLSCFNSDIYSTKQMSSVSSLPYSSDVGLFNGEYRINSITFNDTPYDNNGNYITIHSTSGMVTFNYGLNVGTYIVNVFVAKYNVGNIPYDYNYSNFTISQLSCFNHNTKILCLNNQLKEEYIPVQDLRKGHLVKTYLHGYRKIECIGKGNMINNPTDWQKSMVKMEKTEENKLIEDLIVTGWHGILVNKLTKQEERVQSKMRFTQVIDDKKILCAGLSDKFKIVEDKNEYTFYNFTLEDEGDENKRFGVYANGLLVEIPSKKIFLSKNYYEM